MGFEHLELHCDALGLVGRREVRHQRDRAHRGRCTQPLDRSAEARRRETEPVHAAVHLHEDIDGRFQPRLLEHFELGLVVHHRADALERTHEQVLNREEAFEQQHGPFTARRARPLAQGRRLVDLADREPIGVGQCAFDARQAVAVPVRLDGRQHARTWRQRPGHCMVRGQRGHVDHGLQRTRHQAPFAPAAAGASSCPRID